ncbi:MAG: metallo-mystery pair system four-Cys motif protein [Myxococcales bacterium]|nr:metallo-mystery pair system four-Cys motif protein [Myxococcales bacterium]
MLIEQATPESRRRCPHPWWPLLLVALTSGCSDTPVEPATDSETSAVGPDAGTQHNDPMRVYFEPDGGADLDAGFRLGAPEPRMGPHMEPRLDPGVDPDGGAEHQDAAQKSAGNDSGAGRRPSEGTGAQESDGLEDLSRFELHFDAQLAGTPIECDRELDGAGQPASVVTLRDLRFFVSDLVLLQADGTGVAATLASDGRFHNGEVALLDFENGQGDCEGGDPEVNRVVRAGVPPGSYVGLALQIGVPERLNHGDPTEADAPLDLTAMHWSWNDGYKHLRTDLRLAAGGTFAIHIGSTRCDRSPGDASTQCAQKNRAEIVLSRFDPRTHRIVLDLNALLAGMDLSANIPGCIAGATPETCPQVLAALGIDPQSGSPVPEGQVVFRAEERE